MPPQAPAPPARRAPVKTAKRVEVAAAMTVRDGRVLATQRGYGEFKDGWEFPGGKVEPGETPEAALAREIREELAAEVDVGALACRVEYDYPAFHLSMACFWCTLADGRMELLEHEAARWLDAASLGEVAWLPADAAVIDALRRQGIRPPAPLVLTNGA